MVELGPEGGEGGGRIVAEGSPREIAKQPTATGAVLKALLSANRAQARSAQAQSSCTGISCDAEPPV